MECTQINQLQTFANSDSGAAGEHIASEAVLWECSVTATREGPLLVQLKQPATQILTALLLQQRRWDRPTRLQDSKLIGAERNISFSHCTF